MTSCAVPTADCPRSPEWAFLVLAPASLVDPGKGPEPVLVFAETCREHVRNLRRWYVARGLEHDDVLVLPSFVMREHWDEIVAPFFDAGVAFPSAG